MFHHLGVEMWETVGRHREVLPVFSTGMACRDALSTEAERKKIDELGSTVVQNTTLGTKCIKERRQGNGTRCLPSVLGMYGDPFTCEEISYVLREWASSPHLQGI
jgi:hypothetical protein